MLHPALYRTDRFLSSEQPWIHTNICTSRRRADISAFDTLPHRALFGTSALLQHHSLTLDVSYDTPWHGRVRVQRSLQSHCVVAAALLAGFMPFWTAPSIFTYKSKLARPFSFIRASRTVWCKTNDKTALTRARFFNISLPSATKTGWALLYLSVHSQMKFI